jgi:hypothetical protein
MSATGRLVVLFGVTAIFLWMTIKRIVFDDFGDVRPFDWLMLAIEILVLLLIFYEVAVGFRQKRTIKRRFKTLLILISDGQALEDIAPLQQADVAVVTKWKNDVLEWDNRANKTLASFSKQAVAAYVHDSVDAGVRYRGVAQDAHQVRVGLKSRLDNLKSIMEKPDVYF